DVVGETHHRGFGNLLVKHQGALDLGGAHAVTGDVEHVVHPAGDPVVTIAIAARAIASEVVAGIGGKVGIQHALVVAEYAADLGGPGGLDHQTALTRALDLLALAI